MPVQFLWVDDREDHKKVSENSYQRHGAKKDYLRSYPFGLILAHAAINRNGSCKSKPCVSIRHYALQTIESQQLF